MRRNLTNAVYGMLDYASYPFGMLLVAPIVLHRLGDSEYGLWMVATSVVSAGSIIASGFCDANIQRIAHFRAEENWRSIEGAVRTMLSINLLLGLVLALAVWIAAPYAAQHIAVARSTPSRECLISLRIASVLILVRSIETIGVSTQRAFEEYRSTVRISTAMRFATLAAAAILAALGYRTESLLIATGICLLAGTCMQFRELRRLLGHIPWRPLLRVQPIVALAGFGFFLWLEAVGALIFGQFDRILLGVSLGAAAVAPYSLCVQFSQPILGLIASGLHFLFPYLSARAGVISGHALRRTLLVAFGCNLVLVLCCTGALLLEASPLLRIWAGKAIGARAAGIFPAILFGSACMGLSVTGTYAMQALGLFRTVACLSLGTKIAMLLLMILLLRRMGIDGLVIARVCYGSATLLVYWPLARALRVRSGRTDTTVSGTILAGLQEGPQG